MLLIFSGLLFSNEVSANIDCMGYDWKTNLPETLCENRAIEIKTGQYNSYLSNVKKKDLPVKISVTIQDPIFMHWAGIEINSSLRLRVNNENRRLELLTKNNTTWDVVKFVDAYHIFKQKDNEITILVYLANNQLVAWIDEVKVMEFSQRSLVENQAGLALISGWKSNFSWKGVTFRETEYIAQKKPEKITAVNSCAINNVSLNSSNQVYAKNEVVSVKFSGRCASDVLCSMYNINGHKELEVAAYVSDRENEGRQYECAIVTSKFGTYKITASTKNGENEPNNIDLAVIAVLPDVSKLIQSESYFGGHIDGIDQNWHIDTATIIGLGWVRGHDGIQAGWWTRVQPDSPDQWLWPYDAIIEKLAENRISVLGGLTWSSAWVNNTTGKAYPPEDMEAYKKYVSAVVARYNDSISYWEIWNEPYSKYYWKGTATDYVNMVRNARNAIKSVNPLIKVVGGVLSPFTPEWNRAVLDSGLLQYIDVLSIHFSETDYSDSILAGLVNEARGRGFEGEIWNTETRVYSQDYMGESGGAITKRSKLNHFNAAVEIIRLHLENIAHGIDKIFYYHQISPDRRRAAVANMRDNKDKQITTGMWSRYNNPKSMVSTYTALISLLNGSEFQEKLEKFDSSFYLFEKEGYAVTASIHSGDGKQCQPVDSKLRQSCNAELYDLQANIVNYENNRIAPSLGREPWYMVCHGENSAAKLKTIITQLKCE